MSLLSKMTTIVNWIEANHRYAVLTGKTFHQSCEIVTQSDFNWFEVITRIEALVGLNDSDTVMTQLASVIDKLQIVKKEKRLLEISYEAFLVEKEYNRFQKTQHADALNGCIVTDSVSDDPDTIAKAQSPLDSSLKDVILKKRATIKREMKRTKAKYKEEQRFCTCLGI